MPDATMAVPGASVRVAPDARAADLDELLAWIAARRERAAAREAEQKGGPRDA